MIPHMALLRWGLVIFVEYYVSHVVVLNATTSKTTG